MSLFLIILALLCAFIWWVSHSPAAPAWDNVLTEAEAEAKRAEADRAKVKSWLSRFWAAVKAWQSKPAKTDLEA